MEIVTTPSTPKTYIRKRRTKKSEQLALVGALPDLNEPLWEANGVSGELNNTNGEESTSQTPLEKTETTLISASPLVQDLSSFPIVAIGLTLPPEQSANPVSPDDKQSQEKKIETNVGFFTENEERTTTLCNESHISTNNNLVSSSNSKKRKGVGSDLDQTPHKKPKKKIHRPKVIGTGKPKRTPSKSTQLKPLTPKPKTPKRVLPKKSVSRKPKNKKSIKNSNVQSKCLEFDKEMNQSEDQCFGLTLEDIETSTQVANNSVQVYTRSTQPKLISSSNFKSSITPSKEVGMLRRKCLDLDQEKKNSDDQCFSSAVVPYNAGQVSNNNTQPFLLEINSWIKRGRRAKRIMNKKMAPTTVEKEQALNGELCLFIKTKGKRSKRLRRQYGKRFWKPESKHEVTMIKTNDNELEPSSLVNCDSPKEDNKGDICEVQPDNMEENNEFKFVFPTVTAPSDNFELQTMLSELTSLLDHNSSSLTPDSRGYYDAANTQSIAEMSPSLPSEPLYGTNIWIPTDINIFNEMSCNGMGERSSSVFEDFHTTQLTDLRNAGPFEGRFNLISQSFPSPNICYMGNTHQTQSNFVQNHAQKWDGMVVFNQGSLAEYQSANDPHYEHGGAVVSYVGLPEEKIEKESALVPHTMNGTHIPFQGELSVVKKSKKQLLLELHSQGVNAWKLQLKHFSKMGEQNEEMWDDERKIFRERIDAFIARLHPILGDRTFSEWKGSVVDSVVGVFLTQNVSDNLSSSAFMSLAAKFSSSYESSSENATTVKFLEGPQQLLDKNIANNEQMSLADETVQEQGYMLPTDEKNIENKTKKVNGIDWDAMAKRYCKNIEEEKKEDDQNETNWDEMKRQYHVDGPRNSHHKDAVDWNAVRLAHPSEVAGAIKERGQHNIIALRIQQLLNRVLKLHGDLDLEWLRHAPPEKVKKYLLEFHGLGLKSVECIRLLALQHVAFPVDTNVGRIAVRLGWVPLEPLPEELQIHLLQQFPIMDSIQKYLWPRLQTMDQQKLYQLHYHLITFGKVYCTKRNPNCNDCPMKGECRHFASAYASARHALPRPENKENESSTSPTAAAIDLGLSTNSVPPPLLLENQQYPQSNQNCEPLIEEPASPEPEPPKLEEIDIEDYFRDNEDDDNDLPTLNLGNVMSSISQDQLCMDMMKTLCRENEESRAIVVLPPEVATYPVPKLKSISRLRTKHLVYELPDQHPLLIGLQERDYYDPSPYLLAIWTPDEILNLSQPSVSTNSQQENVETIPGTILIPCRTANKGSFPLNGTYFQTNEVFADHESSHHPIDVPRSWLWNLRKRLVYFGTSTSAIFRGLSTREIQHCFWQGSLCVRAYDRKTGCPRPLAPRFHVSTAHVVKDKTKAKDAKTKTRDDDD